MLWLNYIKQTKALMTILSKGWCGRDFCQLEFLPCSLFVAEGSSIVLTGALYWQAA